MLLKPALSTKGYPEVTLYLDGVSKRCKVHRLVAMAFIPNPNNYPHINHKNEIRDDPRACNLEWCTAQYNNCYNDGQKRRAKNRDYRAIARAHSKPILQYDLRGNLLARWVDAATAGRVLNVSSGGIGAACRRSDVSKKYSDGIAHGYRWDFEGVEYDT